MEITRSRERIQTATKDSGTTATRARKIIVAVLVGALLGCDAKPTLAQTNDLTPLNGLLGTFYAHGSVGNVEMADAFKSVGGSWTKPVAFWSKLQPNDPANDPAGSYDQASIRELDWLVIESRRKGLDVVLVIDGGYAPTWARCINGYGTNFPGPDPAGGYATCSAEATAASPIWL